MPRVRHPLRVEYGNGGDAAVEFEYGVIEESGSHAFLFTERPFGDPPASIAGTSVLDGDDPNDADEALKAVVTKMKRADGLADAETATSGWHETGYAYQGRGRKSELGWGFLGFDATRSTDEASGVVTYRRYRMDFPHYGEVAAVYEYDGAYGSSGTEAMYQRVTTHAVENISHGGTLAAQTKLPRVDDVFEFHFEGGAQIGATKTDHALTVTSGLPASASSTVIVYHTLSPPAGGSSATWGAAPSGTGSSPQRKTASATTFENRTSGGKWVIGFASRIEEKHHRGGVSAADVTAITTFGRSGNATNTLRPSWTLRFPGDSEHELRTAYIYDTDGNATSVTLGTGATSRAESAENFIDSRYPGTLTNAEDQSETLTHDARFGLVKTLTDPNNRTTTLTHDAFGRETLRETPDGVEIETSYESCADSGVDCAAVAGTGSDASVTPVMRIKETSETAGEMDEPVVTFTTWRYLDKLGRTIRTESESFDGAARVRRDTRYDARGRVRLASQPYYSNETAHYHEYAYDARGRVLSETRPDRGVTTMTYIVNSENTNQIKATATEEVYKRGSSTAAATRETVSLYNVMGELVSRTEGARAARCDNLTAPDFKETLEYGGDARVSEAVTKVDGGAETYTHSYRYYSDGRLKTAAYPSELTAYYGYNSRGYRTTLNNGSSGGAALETRGAMDAYGNVTRTTYGNGVTTTRIFDPKTGRARDIDTVASGGTKIQDNAYVWRSDGLLESRASHVGGANAKKETFAYDPLGRLKTATTKLNNSATATRTLSQTYHANGNLKTKTSSVGADMDVSSYTSYGTRAAGPYAGPHAVTGATIEGNSHTYGYDADGNMTSDQCAATGCDDRFIDWNGRNLPERITVGGSQADDTPTARDEFAYGPDGARYHRKTSYMDGETLRTENTYYVGSFEELLPRAGAAHTSIRQTRVTDGVRHVKTTAVSTADDGTKTTNTAKYVDYIHKDHLGSVEGVTDADGASTRALAYDPFGGRRKGDWTAALTPAEVSALAGSSDPRTRGHTGHEHLDRTGLIHRGGRVYDPALGRFLSPDPLVGNRGSAQSWNGYSYVSNSPMSFVDPSGLSQAPGAGGCNLVGVMCGAAGGGFGLASVVSTHRFQWVDIFFSVSSLITLDWGSGSGVIYNYSGESDPYFGGWGWGSFDAFAGVSYGYSYWSGSVQVTSQVALAGTPDITGEDIDSTGGAEHRAAGVVYITGHRYGGSGPWHLAIEYRPEGTEKGRATTLSSEYIHGRGLVSDANRPSDRPRENTTIATVEPPPNKSAEQLFSDLVQLDSAYCDCLPYSTFPGLPRTGGYNSNSYVQGLIDAAGGRVSTDLGEYYGGRVPIPRPQRPTPFVGPR